ncbi:alpha/beta fold hydrolase [Limobrevibacterium gyesilva]|uniref:Alpha/beta hydrolase n=1 Tax=Limobrevibacterium gyesilva TaxID=2991712 RepID=A0AA41YPH4_9PROT|nr:alpha/beta hydrolase [Limobrevibacterium gyesilva]MCW3474263.1 alpha/beta hydrolase [Limobrevibacterium gyesilva]
MRVGSAIAAILVILGLLRPAAAAEDRYFVTGDGVRLHYLEAGRGRTLVFVPGWTMPAWIWQRQIDEFSRQYRVIAFDPRGQGDSAVAPSGYEPGRRGQDIADLIARLGPEPVLLVGWSLGVLDALAYVHANGDTRIAGLVLVDNSVGEDPPPQPSRHPTKPGPRLPREAMMRNFVRGMFKRPQPQAYLDRLTEACLRTPQPAASALLSYPVPRSYWKEAVYSTDKPVLYVVRPKFAGQADNLAAHHPAAEAVVMKEPGHALFVDEPAHFNAILLDFIRRRIWR